MQINLDKIFGTSKDIKQNGTQIEKSLISGFG